MRPLLIVIALACAVMAENRTLLKFRYFDPDATVESWKRGEITYRESLDKRLWLQRQIIDSVEWIWSTGGANHRAELLKKAIQLSSYVKIEEKTSNKQNAGWDNFDWSDTTGRIEDEWHSQWVNGSLTYREYLNLRLKGRRHDWADTNWVAIKLPIEMLKRFYKASDGVLGFLDSPRCSMYCVASYDCDIPYTRVTRHTHIDSLGFLHEDSVISVRVIPQPKGLPAWLDLFWRCVWLLS